MEREALQRNDGARREILGRGGHEGVLNWDSEYVGNFFDCNLDVRREVTFLNGHKPEVSGPTLTQRESRLAVYNPRDGEAINSQSDSGCCGNCIRCFPFCSRECGARDDIVRHLHPNAAGLPLLLVTPVWQRGFRILATRIATRDLKKSGE